MDKSKNQNVRVVAVLLIALAGFLGTGTGCGGGGEAICDKQCECLGCSAQEDEDCKKDAQADEKTANRFKCDSEYAELVNCQNDNFVCRHDRFEIVNCGKQEEALGNCERD